MYKNKRGYIADVIIYHAERVIYRWRDPNAKEGRREGVTCVSHDYFVKNYNLISA